MIYCPFEHSFEEIDGDFGRIQLNKKNYEKIYYLSEYVPIIRNNNKERAKRGLLNTLSLTL